jgi:hypothetical protein
MSKLQEGYLLIADITGYTVYLNKSELDHAQETLTTLLKLLVEHTQPPLVISRLEGDAVISYGLQSNFFQGQTFVEIIENTYVAFRKAIERMVLNNTCRCNACANVSSLDLKFLFHYGTFAIQHVNNLDELVGSDVILIHRLLKNHVQETTGFRAYALYTDAAIQQLGLTDLHETMTAHVESYEHLGEVKVWVQDMYPVWQQKRSASQISIPKERTFHRLETEIDMPPELLWDYLTHLEYRNTLLGSDRQEIIRKDSGRIVPGSVYQCYHGDTIITVTLLEWQPFERMVTQTMLPIPVPNTTILTEYQLIPSGTGTLLVTVDAKPEGPWLGRVWINLMGRMVRKDSQKRTEAFKQRIEADQRQKWVNHEISSQLSTETIRAAAETSLSGEGLD